MTAGLQPNDLLSALDDQILFSEDQFSKLIAMLEDLMSEIETE